jgi:RNA polymerase sigma-70 factor (ECF subfamily)
MAEVATRSREDALDIVQDAMLHLARAYGGRPSEEWPPLFYRIVENKIRDFQRRQGVRSRVFFWRTRGDGEEDEAPQPEELAPDLSVPDATERLMQAEAMHKLQSAIASLPERQRQAFVLRVWDGMSTEEAATVMGCSDGSVKTHLSRALASLRDQLGASWSLEQ